ncbi:hypothetical protein [Pseudoduganella sp. HUAS MS19]
MKRFCLVLAALLLAGCGGGGGAAAPAMSMPDQSPVAPPPADTFTSALLVLVRSTPESTEPADVEGAPLALADGAEPVAVE